MNIKEAELHFALIKKVVPIDWKTEIVCSNPRYDWASYKVVTKPWKANIYIVCFSQNITGDIVYLPYIGKVYGLGTNLHANGSHNGFVSIEPAYKKLKETIENEFKMISSQYEAIC